MMKKLVTVAKGKPITNVRFLSVLTDGTKTILLVGERHTGNTRGTAFASLIDKAFLKHRCDYQIDLFMESNLQSMNYVSPYNSITFDAGKSIPLSQLKNKYDRDLGTQTLTQLEIITKLLSKKIRHPHKQFALYKSGGKTRIQYRKKRKHESKLKCVIRGHYDDIRKIIHNHSVTMRSIRVMYTIMNTSEIIRVSLDNIRGWFLSIDIVCNAIKTRDTSLNIPARLIMKQIKKISVKFYRKVMRELADTTAIYVQEELNKLYESVRLKLPALYSNSVPGKKKSLFFEDLMIKLLYMSTQITDLYTLSRLLKTDSKKSEYMKNIIVYGGILHIYDFNKYQFGLYNYLSNNFGFKTKLFEYNPDSDVSFGYVYQEEEKKQITDPESVGRHRSKIQGTTAPTAFRSITPSGVYLPSRSHVDKRRSRRYQPYRLNR